ncbi:hypothetical protein RJ639_002175 [Escallonia herrerae]|uniref:Leucine-rich repeat-containing N-terminal plant-type domain-containing protein n=1 Tax=Escallonia herrerae TaxID=1293975 RepID=A0AA89BI29_9ASTE|nr:hypothetical protein RJ639_002175 [Escallonia herrerae]
MALEDPLFTPKLMDKFSVTTLLILPILSFTSLGITHVANCPESEREALNDFKIGLIDPEDLLSSWRGRNCCQWRGIGCDNSTGSVMSIDLHNLRWTDLSLNTFRDIQIPAFLGSLKNLQYLNLSNSGFTGKVPPLLGNLSNLQVLDVSSFEFSSLTVDNIAWMTGLVSLKHLGMNQVDLSLVASSWKEVLNMLPLLTELHLSFCSLSGSIVSLTSVNSTSLALIDLSSNSFSSKIPNWIANVSSLVAVDLSNCNLRGRIPLGFHELPSLKSLNLAGNYNLSADCSQLFGGSWQKIEILDLGSNKLHGELPSSLGNMTYLTYFDLSSNHVQGGVPSSIGRLCSLAYLDLSDNNLTGSIPHVLERTQTCVSSSPLPSLIHLILSNNQLVGILPERLGQLENLVELELSYNLLEGPIPASVGTLLYLTDVGLGGNKLNGTLPESFGQLSEATIFDVSSNQLTGFVSEVHFSRLDKLKILWMSSNSFIFNFSSTWVPPFHVRNLDLGSCQLGPPFPAWLENQKELMYLDISNASISGSIPNWFWDLSANLSLFNVSHNQLGGHLLNPLPIAPFADIDFRSNLFEGGIPLPAVEVELLDLSNNKFSGPIPQNIGESMPNLILLSLSDNQLVGDIPSSIGEMLSLQVIDLSGNKLSGNVPSSIGNCSYLKVLDLGSNYLYGMIPSSLAQLRQLQSLHLGLETLDLGNNNLSGSIPLWDGNGFTNLRIINLRTNSFSGVLPSELLNSSSLQVLDLAENNLSGNIPASMSDLKAMVQDQKVNHYLLYGKYRGVYYAESLVVNTKGLPQKYTKTLSLVTSIDLSGNNFDGDFPAELSLLFGLMILNLSRNHISGNIPKSISNLRQLSSLDLSSNKLSGVIPPSMSSLRFLAYLNLSDNVLELGFKPIYIFDIVFLHKYTQSIRTNQHNGLRGMVPYEGQMTTFSASSFAGNPALCGAPLDVGCQGEDSNQGKTVGGSIGGSKFLDKWFGLSIGLGFAVGILVPYLMIVIRKPWNEAYFRFVDKIVYELWGLK